LVTLTRGRTPIVVAALTAIALSGCSQESFLRRIAPPESQLYVRRFVDSLAVAPVDRIAREFTTRLAQEAGVLDSLRNVQRQFAMIGTVDSATLVGANAFSSPGSNTVHRDLSFEVYGARGIALVQVRLVEAGIQRQIDALHIEPLQRPLRAAHGFWQNLRLVQALVLGAAISVAAFSLWAAVQVARTAMPKRWGWALIALVGVGKFAVNWTTGELGTEILSVQLLGASAFRNGLVAPWIVAFSFPIGAIVAMRRRQRALNPVPEPSAAEPASHVPPPAV
jgi:hypothetical protein